MSNEETSHLIADLLEHIVQNESSTQIPSPLWMELTRQATKTDMIVMKTERKEMHLALKSHIGL